MRRGSNKFGENSNELTTRTIKGHTIESDFYVKIEVTLQRIIGGTYHKSMQVPIIIRSRRIPEELDSKFPKVPELLEDAVQLPGAKIEILDENISIKNQSD